MEKALPERLLAGGWWARVRMYAGSNLALGLLCAPRDVRRDLEVLYAFCRVVDDVADEGAMGAGERLEWLRLWREGLRGKRRLPRDLEAVLERRGVERQWLEAVVEGAEDDVRLRFYRTLQDLEGYCWRVAGAVGLACNRVSGCLSPKSAWYAERLGLALQLTNILRDVREDAAQGRVYMPLQWLEEAGEQVRDWVRGRPGRGLEEVWQRLAAEAKRVFAELEGAVPAQDAARMRAAEAMRKVYAELLRQMEHAGARQVWEKKCRIGLARKLLVLLKNLQFSSC